jgi:hypothetical protein
MWARLKERESPGNGQPMPKLPQLPVRLALFTMRKKSLIVERNCHHGLRISCSAIACAMILSSSVCDRGILIPDGNRRLRSSDLRRSPEDVAIGAVPWRSAAVAAQPTSATAGLNAHANANKEPPNRNPSNLRRMGNAFHLCKACSQTWAG